MMVWDLSGGTGGMTDSEWTSGSTGLIATGQYVANF